MGGIPFWEEFRGRDPVWEEFLGRDPGGRSFLGGILLGRSSKATFNSITFILTSGGKVLKKSLGNPYLKLHDIA